MRAGITPPGQPAAFSGSSLARFVWGPRPPWLSPRVWLAELQIEDSPTGWKKYVGQLLFLDAHPTEEQVQDSDDIARGRAIGTDTWRRTMACEHQHRALEQDLPHEEILPLKQARWVAALEQALAHYDLAATDIVPTVRVPLWKVEIAAMVRRNSGAPYRWIAENLRLNQPASLRAAVCWLGRR